MSDPNEPVFLVAVRCPTKLLAQIDAWVMKARRGSRHAMILGLIRHALAHDAPQVMAEMEADPHVYNRKPYGPHKKPNAPRALAEPAPKAKRLQKAKAALAAAKPIGAGKKTAAPATPQPPAKPFPGSRLKGEWKPAKGKPGKTAAK